MVTRVGDDMWLGCIVQIGLVTMWFVCTNRVGDDVVCVQIGLVTMWSSVQIGLVTMWFVYK